MRFCRRCIIAVLVLAVSAGVSGATVLWNNPFVVYSEFYMGMISVTDYQEIAEDFTLPQAAVASNITFWGFMSEGSSSAFFDIAFFHDDGSSMPQNNPFYVYHTAETQQGADTGVDAGYWNDFNFREWTLSIPEVQFDAPGRYWVSVLGAYENGWEDFVWTWGSINGDGGNVGRGGSNTPWDWDPWEYDTQAFALDGEWRLSEVPEPSTLSHLVLVLLASTLLKLRHRKR